MLKSADALAEGGYDIRVIATRHEPWASETDRAVAAARQWAAEVVTYSRGEGGATYWWTGARQRAARAAAAGFGPARVPRAIVSRAFGRVHSELVRAIAADPGDLIYGGTTGALAAVAEAGRRTGTPYAVDFEDLHSAETLGADAPLVDALAALVERDVIAGAVFVTTSSEAIGAEYLRRHGVEPAVIHNTFPLPPAPPTFGRDSSRPFKTYWFSQTIGPARGIEEAIVALGRAGISAEMVLLGRAQDGYLEAIRRLAHAEAPQVAVIHHPPVAPGAMVESARGHDAGLALDHGPPLNRDLCITNKALTYILAGVPVVMADTPGQHALGIDLGRGAALVPAGDVDALAAAFAAWALDPAALDCAKRTAWQRAVSRWHWEHDTERGTLYGLVGGVLS